MIQEYLFTSDKYKSDIESLVVKDEIIKEINEIENSSCWILNLSVDGENEKAAKILNAINIEICEEYNPTVLSNGCSAYFNKLLFPIINEFERKLRKLLYLGSALQGNDEAHKNIKDLESKDLGKIFETLFCDSDFVKNIKSEINNKKTNFTRMELIAIIEKIDENTLWDKILGPDCTETLREKFDEIRKYRNDVMHAHNICLEQFKSAKKLFNKVNEELDIAIGRLVGAVEESKSIIDKDYNKTLGLALSSIENPIMVNDFPDFSKILVIPQDTNSLELKNNLHKITKLDNGKYVSMTKLKYEELINSLNKINALKSEISPAIRELKSISEQMKPYKIEIPSAITKLQQGLLEVKNNYSISNTKFIERNEEDEING